MNHKYTAKSTPLIPHCARPDPIKRRVKERFLEGANLKWKNLGSTREIFLHEIFPFKNLPSTLDNFWQVNFPVKNLALTLEQKTLENTLFGFGCHLGHKMGYKILNFAFCDLIFYYLTILQKIMGKTVWNVCLKNTLDAL